MPKKLNKTDATCNLNVSLPQAKGLAPISQSISSLSLLPWTALDERAALRNSGSGQSLFSTKIKARKLLHLTTSWSIISPISEFINKTVQLLCNQILHLHQFFLLAVLK